MMLNGAATGTIGNMYASIKIIEWIGNQREISSGF